MNITLYTICWNEDRMLDFFFRHYDQYVNHYIFYDDGSTDRTLDILRSKKNVEIRKFPRSHEFSYVYSAQNLHNDMWKECKETSDWVIITPVDEFLYHKNMKTYLKESLNKGISCIPAMGYKMISQKFPHPSDNLIDKIKTGARCNMMDKISILNPKKLKEINYEVGRHRAKPEGDIIYPKQTELLNLHFKYLSFDYIKKRYQELNNKLGIDDKKNKLGYHYGFSESELRRIFQELENESYNVIETFEDQSLYSLLKLMRKFS